MHRCRSFSAVLCLALGLAATGERRAAAVTPGEFAALSTDAQRALIKQTIEARLERLRNVRFHAKTEIYKVKDDHGGPGERLTGPNTNFGSYVCDFRRTGNDYWARLTQFVPEHTAPEFTVTTQYDSATDTVRSLKNHRGTDQTVGHVRLDDEQFFDSAKYRQWVDFLDRPGLFPLNANWYRCLLRYAASWEFTPANAEANCVWVKFVVRDRRRVNPPGIDTIGDGLVLSYELDLSKDCLPRQIITRRLDAPSTVFLDAKVVESQPIDGLWMPTHIIEYSGGHDSPTGCVHETTAHDIVLTASAKDDLTVQFPDGVEVVDSIHNEMYTVGKPGKVKLDRNGMPIDPATGRAHRLAQ